MQHLLPLSCPNILHTPSSFLKLPTLRLIFVFYYLLFPPRTCFPSCDEVKVFARPTKAFAHGNLQTMLMSNNILFCHPLAPCSKSDEYSLILTFFFPNVGNYFSLPSSYLFLRPLFALPSIISLIVLKPHPPFKMGGGLLGNLASIA